MPFQQFWGCAEEEARDRGSPGEGARHCRTTTKWRAHERELLRERQQEQEQRHAGKVTKATASRNATGTATAPSSTPTLGQSDVNGAF